MLVLIRGLIKKNLGQIQIEKFSVFLAQLTQGIRMVCCFLLPRGKQGSVYIRPATVLQGALERRANRIVLDVHAAGSGAGSAQE